jgi:hypothetical protein
VLPSPSSSPTPERAPWRLIPRLAPRPRRSGTRLARPPTARACVPGRRREDRVRVGRACRPLLAKHILPFSWPTRTTRSRTRVTRNRPADKGAAAEVDAQRGGVAVVRFGDHGTTTEATPRDRGRHAHRRSAGQRSVA